MTLELTHSLSLLYEQKTATRAERTVGHSYRTNPRTSLSLDDDDRSPTMMTTSPPATTTKTSPPATMTSPPAMTTSPQATTTARLPRESRVLGRYRRRRQYFTVRVKEPTVYGCCTALRSTPSSIRLLDDGIPSSVRLLDGGPAEDTKYTHDDGTFPVAYGYWTTTLVLRRTLKIPQTVVLRRTLKIPQTWSCGGH